MDEVLSVGVLLVFQQAAHPLIAALVPGALAVLLVLPVGGHAVLGDLVHFFRPYLYLEGDAAFAHHRGVQALVHIGLRRADVILEPAQNGLEQVVDNAQHVVAVRHRVHNDPEGEQVKHIVQALVLGVHFAVDGVGVLHPAVDRGVDALLLQPRDDAVVHGGHEPVVLRGLFVQRLGDLPVAHRVQILQRQVLQLPFHLLHTQSVCNGSVDLHSLKGLLLLLLRRLVLHGPHIVQPVGDLDEDDPDVLGHGHEHLPQVLHLLLFFGGVVDPRQLADALHQIRHRGGKQLCQLLVGGGGILDGVVQQGRHNRLCVQVQLLRHDLCHRQGMCDKGRAVLAVLPRVVGIGEFIGGAYLVKARRRVVALYRLHKMFVLLLRCHSAPPPFSLSFCSVFISGD